MQLRFLSGIHCLVVGARHNAGDPGCDARTRSEIETAFLRHMRISEQGDVGKSERLAGHERCPQKLPVHDVERPVAGNALLFEIRAALWRIAEISDNKPRRRDVRLVTALLSA